MSRWLYYIVNTLSVLDSFFFSDFRDVIIKSLEKYSTALDDISNYLDDDKNDFDHTLSLMTMVTLSNGGVEKLDFIIKERLVHLMTCWLTSFRKSRILSRCVECLIFWDY